MREAVGRSIFTCNTTTRRLEKNISETYTWNWNWNRNVLKLTILWYRAQQCTTYRAQASFSIHQTTRCGLRSTSRIPSSPAMTRPGNWNAGGTFPPGFSTTSTWPNQRVSSSSTPRTSVCVRAPERRRALRIPRKERLNCPALLALVSDTGGTVAGSGALRGR